MLAIVSAMQEEIAAVVGSLANATTEEFGGRRFHVGSFEGMRAVTVFSRIGKVAAAATVTQLLAAYPVTRLIFSGVAGGVQHGLSIGDIVIATQLIQHDMDASPIFPRYEIPLLGKSLFPADPEISKQLTSAASTFLHEDLGSLVAAGELSFFRITAPKVLEGVIASGDKFFANAEEVRDLHHRLPNVACVEMEGAAVAQVCDEYAIPFGVLRTISDSADENSPHDFPRFAREIARHYSVGVLSRFVRGL